jgi:hypothetical protein
MLTIAHISTMWTIVNIVVMLAFVNIRDLWTNANIAN